MLCYHQLSFIFPTGKLYRL